MAKEEADVTIVDTPGFGDDDTMGNLLKSILHLYHEIGILKYVVPVL